MSVEEVREAVRAGGLLDGGRPLVAMLSGGRDSVCLLDVAVALCGAQAVHALHVNYGLRDAADGDERHCAALCRTLGVELSVVRAAGAPGGAGPPGATGSPGGAGAEGEHGAAPDAPDRAPGNLQAWARALRYDAAERRAAELGEDARIAAGHTASDQVETILYRLAASPGRRALLGMAASEGRLVRPLLVISRAQTAAYCEARGLTWREDRSNDDERFARVRVRARVVPALRSVHPAAEANVLRTAQLLREETELLRELVERELGGGGAGASIAMARLAELAPALARLVVIQLAEQASGTYVPQAGERVQELLALWRRGGRAELHVGGQAGAVIEHGVLRMWRLPPRDPRDPHRTPGEPREPPPDGD